MPITWPSSTLPSTVTERDGRRETTWWPQFRIIDTATVAPDPRSPPRSPVRGGVLARDGRADRHHRGGARQPQRHRAHGRGSDRQPVHRRHAHHAGADAAIMNGGGIRAGKVYAPGSTITRRDVLAELPFNNSVVTVEISGRGLRHAMENGLSQMPDCGRGASRRCRASRGGRRHAARPAAASRRCGSAAQPLDDARIYKVATIDFIARGGDGYVTLRDARRLLPDDDSPLLANQVMEYLRQIGTVRTGVEGRIVFDEFSACNAPRSAARRAGLGDFRGLIVVSASPRCRRCRRPRRRRSQRRREPRRPTPAADAPAAAPARAAGARCDAAAYPACSCRRRPARRKPAAASIRITQAGVKPDGEIVGEGGTVRLYGVAFPDPKQDLHAASGESWPCGRRAYITLHNRIAAETVSCEPRATTEPAHADCHVGDANLAEWMLAEGLARLAADVPDEDWSRRKRGRRRRSLVSGGPGGRRPVGTATLTHRERAGPPGPALVFRPVGLRPPLVRRSAESPWADGDHIMPVDHWGFRGGHRSDNRTRAFGSTGRLPRSGNRRYPELRSSAITLPSLGRLPGGTSFTSPRSLVTAVQGRGDRLLQPGAGAAHSASRS